MSKPDKGCFLTLLPGSLLSSAHLELITPGHGADHSVVTLTVALNREQKYFQRHFPLDALLPSRM